MKIAFKNDMRHSFLFSPTKQITKISDQFFFNYVRQGTNGIYL